LEEIGGVEEMEHPLELLKKPGRQQLSGRQEQHNYAAELPV